MNASSVIPAVLFAYSRPDHLARVLKCLREDAVPLLYVFADGAKTPEKASAVAQTRQLLRAIDWCEVKLTERAENFGLGRNVLTGISEVAAKHEAFIVWEDDIVFVPGTYVWISAALRNYADDPRVFSVGAWTHPRVTPPGVRLTPYFDQRAECWGWGSYARAWRGMNEETALQKMAACKRAGVSPDCCGSDLPLMARDEAARNLWAVRWVYHHLQHHALCLRPPWSLSEHKGFDAQATNAHAQHAADWSNNALLPAPPIPEPWPVPAVDPAVSELWRRALPVAAKGSVLRRGFRLLGRALPQTWRNAYGQRFVNRRWEGDYDSWLNASADSVGYAAPNILKRASVAARKVQAGRALFERDGVAFKTPGPIWPPLDWLSLWAKGQGGSLRVIDFGGSLGTRYYQHRDVWDALPHASWRVVDQAPVVAAGRQEFSTQRLTFHETIDEALGGDVPDVLLLSAVLQYLENPHATIRELVARKFSVIVLGRVPIISRGRDRLTVQHVPAFPKPLSYPCWQFDREVLMKNFEENYRMVLEFPGADGELGGATYMGFIFMRASSSSSPLPRQS